MSKIQFEIPGKPVGKARARSTKSGHHFTPKKTVYYEKTVALVAEAAMQGQAPWTSPVTLTVSMVCAPADSWPKWKREGALIGQIAPTTKPDLDNVLKSLKDAMNGIVYVDDCQVVSVSMSKFYGDSDYVRIIVSESHQTALQQARAA